MPRNRKTKSNRKPRVRKARKASAHIPRGLATVPQTAKVVETIVIGDLLSNQIRPYNFSLQMFTRARLLSLGYQRVKAVKCTWTYEPLFNTFQDQVGNSALSVPFMYSRMNRGQDSRVPQSLGDLQAMGAQPRKFTNTVRISYRPNWVSPGMLGSNTLLTQTVNGGQQQMIQSITCYGLKQEYGYLENSPYNQTQDPGGSVIIPVGLPRRNPGTLVPDLEDTAINNGVVAPNVQSMLCLYNGHDVYFDQAQLGNEPNFITRVTLTVEWHFKDPKWWDQIIQTNTNFNPPPSRTEDGVLPG